MNERITSLQAALAPRQGFLVTGEASRLYLTGFPSSAGTVLVTPDKSYFLIDFRYIEKAKKCVTSCEVMLADKLYAQVAELCRRHGIDEMFVETEVMSIRAREGWATAVPEVEWLTSPAIEERLTAMRRVKTPAELALIRRAQRMTDETFAYILDRIRPGRTERDVMLDMEFDIRRRGSEGVSFDFIVVSGANSSLPHGVPTDKPIAPGDFVTMDFGAVVDGYRSDMTRTVAVGAVSDDQRRVYDTVLAAQRAALAEIRPGACCRAVDKVARDIIDAAGYEGCFGHALGHSVGIEIHESPNFSPRCEHLLEPGNVMTVEPGIYLENRFGVRIEDMVAVTADGCENLTASPKELILLS